mmetsp:Transcript_25734/g.74456  ORF Transcript_25734/g.74456 Transcript_25734/m.74456 type:complete len:238 (-) Transcript_25734:168-881(-)
MVRLMPVHPALPERAPGQAWRRQSQHPHGDSSGHRPLLPRLGLYGRCSCRGDHAMCVFRQRPTWRATLVCAQCGGLYRRVLPRLHARCVHQNERGPLRLPRRRGPGYHRCRPLRVRWTVGQGRLGPRGARLPLGAGPAGGRRPEAEKQQVRAQPGGACASGCGAARPSRGAGRAGGTGGVPRRWQQRRPPSPPWQLRTCSFCSSCCWQRCLHHRAAPGQDGAAREQAYLSAGANGGA